MTTLKQRVKELKLIPGKGGCFELKADGELVYSKLKTGEFPDEQTILQELENRVNRKR